MVENCDYRSCQIAKRPKWQAMTAENPKNTFLIGKVAFLMSAVLIKM